MVAGRFKLIQFGLLHQVVCLQCHVVNHIVPRHGERPNLIPRSEDFDGLLTLGEEQQSFVDLVAISLAHEESVKHSLRAIFDIPATRVPRFYFERHWTGAGRLPDLAAIVEWSLLVFDNSRDRSIQFTLETVGGGPDVLLDIEDLCNRKQ